MSKPKASVVAKWIENRARNLNVLPMRDVMAAVLAEEFRHNSSRPVSSEEIAETVDELLDKVALELAVIAEDYIREGVDPSFLVETGDGDHYYRCKESPDRELRANLARMTPGGFEHFCRAVLNELSGNARVTGGPNDQCVDFYAVGLPLAGGEGPFPQAARLVVVGQAKRWKTDAEIWLSDIREFVGAAILRADELRREHADRCGLLTPICFAFWATCDFSVGAKRFADNLGLWYLNGKALAQLAIRVGLGEQSIADAEQAAAVR